jgi:predicted amidohydrolase YtcJ
VETALTRQTSEGKPEYGFVPQQRLSLEDTLRAYTLGAAFAGRREKTEGSIETGKLADMIILDRNLFQIEPTDIRNTEVLMTIVGGKIVYESPNWKTAAATKRKQ